LQPGIQLVCFRFVRTLRQDLAAVRNAITETWSNGQTEGQINRLKMLLCPFSRVPDAKFHPVFSVPGDG
jgi:hypothetical protein